MGGGSRSEETTHSRKGRQVGNLVTGVCHVKLTELIKLLFGWRTHIGQKNHVLHIRVKIEQISSAMWPFSKLFWTLPLTLKPVTPVYLRKSGSIL